MFANSRRAGLTAGLAFLLTTFGAASARSAEPPILTTLAREGRFQTFLHAVNTANLAGTLHGPGPITVFAPDDDAFAKLPSTQKDALMSNPEQLKRLLSFYIVPARVTVANLSQTRHGQTPATLEGDPLRVASAVGVTTVNGAPIVKPDIPAKNGVIQEVGAVIMPPTEITAPPGKYVPPKVATPAPIRTQPPAATAPPHAAITPAPATPPVNGTPGIPHNAPSTSPAPPNPSAPTNLPMMPANPPTTPGAPGTTPAPVNPPAQTTPSTPPPAPTQSAPATGTPAASNPQNNQTGAPTDQQPGAIPGENAP